MYKRAFEIMYSFPLFEAGKPKREWETIGFCFDEIILESVQIDILIKPKLVTSILNQKFPIFYVQKSFQDNVQFSLI